MKIEHKLLISLLGDLSESKVKVLLSEDIDWAIFVETAKDHRVIPLLFQKLTPRKTLLPSEVFNDLARRAEKAALTNLEFSRELQAFSTLLQDQGIEFLAYKGLTLAQLAYGDPSLRRFGDLDIFIRKRDFSAANRAILENGGIAAWNLSESQDRAVRKYYYEYPYFFGDRPVIVEVHWAFLESFFGFDYEKSDVFKRSQKVKVHGMEFPTLSNEDLLIILCAHGSKHYWTRLSWICDIAKLLESQPINWDLATHLAKHHGSLRMLALGVNLAGKLFSAELHDDVRRQIGINETVHSITNTFFENLFKSGAPDESIRIKLHMKMRERWRDKFTYSRRLFRTKVIDSIFMPMGRPT